MIFNDVSYMHDLEGAIFTFTGEPRFYLPIVPNIQMEPSCK